MQQTLILASASPRRRELLSAAGLSFQVRNARTEEISSGAPEEIVSENARRKAGAVWKDCPGAVVLGADTIVYCNGQALGKPQDAEDARRMLRMLSGSWHTVYTGVCVIDAKGCEDTRWDATRVRFLSLSEETISRYVASGEPMDKAGAYAVQGRGGMYVSRIEGSYSNVIGLPMALTREMLIRAGFEEL